MLKIDRGPSWGDQNEAGARLYRASPVTIEEASDMAEVSQREWRIPGTKRKGWGFTLTTKVDGKPKRIKTYRTEWTKEQAQEALAKVLLKIEEPKPKASGITFKTAIEQYVAAKALKKTLASDERFLNEFSAAFGAEALLSEITAAKISAWKADKLKATN
jgi:hypothetical protein